jgi:hypothetical protein
MTFKSEIEFKYWLKINGYVADSIEQMSYRWNSISIINDQITDSVTQSTSPEELNTEIINEVSDISNTETINEVSDISN